ncbi:MAG: hypothetical protein IJC66_06450 [Kiritimatiellae bacterium]|nr:hypothetical protein [Kiritimatiellia bacterium]
MPIFPKFRLLCYNTVTLEIGGSCLTFGAWCSVRSWCITATETSWAKVAREAGLVSQA